MNKKIFLYGLFFIFGVFTIGFNGWRGEFFSAFAGVAMIIISILLILLEKHIQQLEKHIQKFKKQNKIE